MALVVSQEFTSALRRHASDFCSLLLGAVDDIAMYLLDPQGRIVSWNTGAERITGYPADDVLNQPFATLFTPGDVAAGVPQRLQAAALAEGRYQEEITRTRKDGTPFIGQRTLTALFADDRHVGFAVVTRDVSTERRSERPFRAMLESGSDVISVHDADGTVTYQSPSIERVLGYTPSDLLGRKVSDYLHPDDLAAADDYTNRLKAGGDGPSSVEVRFRHKSGEWRWFDCTGTNLLADAAVNGLQFTARDVTERKRAEADLRRSELRYRTLATASNKLIWSATPGGEMVPSFDGTSDTTFAGRRRAEASGRGWVDVVHPDDRERATREWREATASGQPLAIEARIRRADGEWRRIAARMIPVKDSAGTIEEWVGVGEDVTDLRDTETWLRAVLNSTFDGIITTDGRGVIVSANASAHRKFGYPDGELVGHRVMALMPEAAWKRHPRGVPDQLHAGERLNTGSVQQVTGRRQDGSAFPIELTVTEFRLHDARHFTGVVRDLSRRRQDETALQASEQRLRAIIDTAPLSVQLITRDETVQEMNASALRLVEADRADEVVGHNVLPLIAPEDRDRYRNFHRSVCAGTPGTLEYDLVGRRGTRSTVESTSTPFRNDDAIVGALCVSQDVTERRRAEEQLRLRDRAIQAIAEGILITDPNQPDNPIVYASPSLERLTGYAAHEVVGKNCRFLQGKDTNPETVAEVRRAVADGRSCSVEILNYRKDGTPFWNALSISPVRNGHLTHFIGVQHDVTERRRLEDQFRQAQKMEAVGQLAGGVAHDFNNLLTVINGYSELMLTALPPGDRNRELLAEIHKAGEQAGTLTRQLLMFSRQEVLEPTALDLNEVVTGIENLLRRLLGEDIRFATRLAPTLGSIKADTGQIEQVITNLCLNARDAMPTGGQLTIETQSVVLDEGYARTHSGVSPGEYALLAVSDTGTGMDGATKSRIFEPFFTTKGPGKGTGLGLAVVFGVVKQGGGHVEVYTELGRGTTFKVYLPQVRDRVSPGKSLHGVSLMPRGTETVLLVEDEEAVRALTRHILTDCGYTVLEAGDGREAIGVAERHSGPLALLISDVVMPHLGGRQLAEQILALRPGIKTLFISGYTDDAVVRHGVLDAQYSFLQKPFTPSGLAVKVRDVLDGPSDGRGGTP